MKTKEVRQTGSLEFDRLLSESAALHGHLCPGQVLGVRMSLCGLTEIGIEDPRGVDRKSLITFVEMDRCATDAIGSVTGCSLGKRTMKFMDYGKMAATYLNLQTGKAVRVLAREEAKNSAAGYFPGIHDKYKAQIAAYKIMPEEELFDISEVSVSLRCEDMPGRPIGKSKCALCGEFIRDRREVRVGNAVLCRPCAGGGYYSICQGDRYAKKT